MSVPAQNPPTVRDFALSGGRTMVEDPCVARPLRILFLAAEAAPFAQTGGLGDVVGSLPKALAALGHDVRVAVPAYAWIERALEEGQEGLQAAPFTLSVPIAAGFLPAGALRTTLPGSPVDIWFVAERHLFARPRMYGYADDPYRFAFFARAALDLMVGVLGWRPDIVHAHDWHAAPAVLWLAAGGPADPRYRGIATVFTIHNLQHQGRTSHELLRYLQVADRPLPEEGFGEVNLMARAISHATAINTVSPSYAREIMTREGGAGLDGLLRRRHKDLHGILNGLDFGVWNPETDPHLTTRFTAATLGRRHENKRALQSRIGLPLRDEVPVVAMVSRLDQQKGFDIVGHVLHLLLNGLGGDAQCIVVGSGAGHYEDMLRHLAGYHRDGMRVVFGYDAALAHAVYGGSDLFLMPSLFEPCGLGQLIAMRYGCIPIVRAVGGLADTVHDLATGFTFYEATAEACWVALRRALHTFREDADSWRAMQERGMAFDSSWTASARGYHQLYGWARSSTIDG
jgi:starch synthase